MTELKTLKDLAWTISHGKYKQKNSVKYIEESDLKAEAIKWVKDYRNNNPYPKLIEWRGYVAKDFMKFFNLTEADLK